MSQSTAWLLKLHDSLGEHCDQAINKLEGIFAENTKWLEARRAAAMSKAAKGHKGKPGAGTAASRSSAGPAASRISIGSAAPRISAGSAALRISAGSAAPRISAITVPPSVSKPRGRPKKLPTPLAEVATESIPEMSISRPRGRPRKIKIPESDSDFASELSSAPLARRSISVPPSVTKARARPRKHPVPPAEPVSELLSEASAAPGEPGVQAPTRKQRGRAKKAKTETKPSSSSESTASTESVGFPVEQPPQHQPSEAPQAVEDIAAALPAKEKRPEADATLQAEPGNDEAIRAVATTPRQRRDTLIDPTTPFPATTIEIVIETPVESKTAPRLSISRPVPVEQPKAEPPKGTGMHGAAPSHPVVESWTSQFVKNVPKVDVPSRLREAIAVEELGVACAVSEEPAAELPPQMEDEPAELEVQPAARKQDPRLVQIMGAEPPAESPLTRAKRIDSQNIWREQQLSKFFVSKTEILKNAIDTLKVVKEEERTSKMLQRETTNAEPVYTAPQADPSPVRPLISEERFILTVPAPEALPVLASAPVSTILLSPLPPLVVEEPEIISAPVTPVVAKKRESYHDIFQVVSPLKLRKQPAAIEPSTDFLDTCEAPKFTDTAIPDEMPVAPVAAHCDADVFESRLPVKREPSAVMISEEERAKRQRLKERQQQAIDKRKELMQKAQDHKNKLTEAAAAKTRPLGYKPAPSLGPQLKPSAVVRSGAGSTASGLHKAAIFNASKTNLSIGGSAKPDFKTPAAKIKSPAPIKMAEKVVSSPLFPEIHSDDEEYLKCGKDAKTRPDWATTPAVKAALLEQQSCPVDKIFDKIQPVRLEDIFKNKTFKRGRNSTIPFL